MKHSIKNKIPTILNIFKNLILIAICIITLYFENISTITYLYLLPIYLILTSLFYIYTAEKTKENDLYKWVINIIYSILFNTLCLIIVINKNITDKYFIILFTFIYFSKALYLCINKNKKLLFIISTIISCLLLIFIDFIVNTLYFYIIIALLIIALIEIILSIKKKKA